MKKLYGFIVLVLGILIFGWVSLFGGLDQPLTLDGNTVYTIQAGATISSIANDLEQKNIIDAARDLKLLSKLEKAELIFAGDYEITPDMNLKDFLALITADNALRDEVTVTIVEGLTMDQIADEYVESGLLDSSELFMDLAENNVDQFAKTYSFLEGETRLEGYLYPETYRFFKDATEEDIINKMLSEFDRRFAQKLKDYSGEYTTHELLTLASIVEREVRKPDEMKVVAGLFYNRLEIGMALQADSTVGYITRSGRDRSTYADLQIDSPYNSYKYAGLPPGPISNPGANAIEAVLSPTDTDYFFFLTDSQGTVYYATDLAGHNRNRELYLD